MQEMYNTEARFEYERAQKMAKKEYSQRTSRGESGTLLVLDQITEQSKIMAYVKRPDMEIELSRVVGTYTSGRAHSFSASFLPLTSESSEFASKWINLCATHMSEGLRDPIEVYEYLWDYYVIEGNKRVSILKYFGAPTARAKITRLIPQLDPNDEKTALYYAFLKYEKNGLFKTVIMSSAEKYEQLSELEKKLLIEDEAANNTDLNAVYIKFSSACKAANVDMAVGDVLLEYLKLYGIPFDIVLSELTQKIEALKPQLAVASAKKEPVIVLEKTEQAPQSFISRIFSPKKTARVLFVYDEGRTDKNWIGAHEKGRQKMQAKLHESVESCFIDGLTDENAEELLEPYKDKVDLVLFTSTKHSIPALRFQLENKDVIAMVYSRVREDSRLLTYYGRYYEAAFMCGIAAGYASTSNKIAYITPHTEKRFTADINAFGLGVKAVNPKADVYLIQKNVIPFDYMSSKNGMKIAKELGVDVVLSQLYEGIELENLPDTVFSAVLGLDKHGEPNCYYAAPEWNWGRFYTEIVRAYLNNSLEALSEIEDKEKGVAGFWWGMGTGVIKFKAENCPHSAAENMMKFIRGSLALSRYSPFQGPITDKEGNLQLIEDASLKPYDILCMDWISDFIQVVD